MDVHSFGRRALQLWVTFSNAAALFNLRRSNQQHTHGVGEYAFANLPAWHFVQFRHSFVKGTEMLFDKGLHACEVQLSNDE